MLEELGNETYLILDEDQKTKLNADLELVKTVRRIPGCGSVTDDRKIREEVRKAINMEGEPSTNPFQLLYKATYSMCGKNGKPGRASLKDADFMVWKHLCDGILKVCC